MEISPPLMPGNVTALVTVKLVAGEIAFSYEDAVANNWVTAFVGDLAAGRFASRNYGADGGFDTDLLESGRA